MDELKLGCGLAYIPFTFAGNFDNKLYYLTVYRDQINCWMLYLFFPEKGHVLKLLKS